MKTYNLNLKNSFSYFSLAVWIVFFMSLPFRFFAQYCDNNTTTGSTINAFDWTTSTFDAWIENSGEAILKEIPSPFYPSPMNINQLNTSYLWSFPSENNEPQDFLPEEGWELLYYGLGTFESPTDIPSLVLYHRPTGKMRLLVYLEEIGGVDYSELYMKHPSQVGSHVSAVLEHGTLPIHSVEGYENRDIVINTPNKIWDVTVGSGDTEGIWMVAEIPAYYDPCLCQFQSTLAFGVTVANTADFTIVLEGNGDVTQVFPTPSSGSSDDLTLKGIYKRASYISKAYTKGVKSYKSFGAFLGALENFLVGRANSNITSEMIPALTSLGLPSQNLNAAHLQTLWGLAHQEVDPNNSTQVAQVQTASTLLTQILPGAQSNDILLPDWIKSSVPFAAAALTLLDYFIGGGKSATAPKPLHFKASYRFSGTGEFIDSTAIREYVFDTPGSMIGLNAQRPVYDNPLGVLSIVNKIDVTHTQIWSDDEEGALYHDAYQLTRPIQYAVNPMAGLKPIPKEIRASFRVISHYPINDFPPAGNFPIWIPNTGLIQVDDTTYRTPYLPLSCLPAYKIRLTDFVEGGVLDGRSAPEIYLHLVALLERNTPGVNAEDVFLSQFYAVNLVTTPSEVEENTSLLNVPELVHVATIDEYLQNNPHAWNGIVVDGDITLDETNFSTVVNHIYPSHEIVVTPADGGVSFVIDAPLMPDLQYGDVIGGGTVFQNLPACYEITPPMTGTELESFCTDPSKYNPVKSKKEEISLDSSDLSLDLPQNELSASLFPNPTTERKFTLNFILPEKSKIWILLSDQYGHSSYLLLDGEVMSGGEHHIPVEVRDLPKGTYFVEIRSSLHENHPIVLKWVLL